MTDDALRALRDAVKAGTATMPLATACYPRDASGRMLPDKKGWHDANVMGAYQGSLDAAHALHKAVLPGWVWNVVDSSTTVWPDFPGDPRDYQEGYAEGNPARAWLLAILEAIIAQQGAGKGGE